MLNSTLNILFWIFFLYCIFSVTYLFLLSFFGNFFYRKKVTEFAKAESFKKIAVLVPGYKEDGIIVSSAKSLLQQDFPPEYYDVFIIADSFQQQTLKQLYELPVKVLEVSFEKSTKLKSLDEAFNRIGDGYDIAVICDADNVLGQDVLRQFNACFLHGAAAIQGQRVAKNLDTPFAVLDACSEAINNHIFRKGANAVGLSSSVIGSGMAFDYAMFKKIVHDINSKGGVIVHEDKILQLDVIRQGFKIYYLENALIFDEKVDSPQAFKQQRKRWILGQFIYLKEFFVPALKELMKGNISYFNIAVLHNLVLPRAFMLIVLFLLIPISFLVSTVFGWAAILLLCIYLVTLIISLPAGLFNKDLLEALLRLPKAIALMAGTLFRSKKANDTFIHTVHTRTEVSNTYLNKNSKKSI